MYPEAVRHFIEALRRNPKDPTLTFLEVIDKERCKLLSVVTNGVLKLSMQARFHGILVGPSYVATGFRNSIQIGDSVHPLK